MFYFILLSLLLYYYNYIIIRLTFRLLLFRTRYNYKISFCTVYFIKNAIIYLKQLI
jgi:hypothetical protein